MKASARPKIKPRKAFSRPTGSSRIENKEKEQVMTTCSFSGKNGETDGARTRDNRNHNPGLY
ncbi:MAG: hypothetical protein ACQKBY_12005, partial [Verrucomicrobiales bacterium]